MPSYHKYINEIRRQLTRHSYSILLTVHPSYDKGQRSNASRLFAFRPWHRGLSLCEGRPLWLRVHRRRRHIQLRFRVHRRRRFQSCHAPPPFQSFCASTTLYPAWARRYYHWDHGRGWLEMVMEVLLILVRQQELS